MTLEHVEVVDGRWSWRLTVPRYFILYKSNYSRILVESRVRSIGEQIYGLALLSQTIFPLRTLRIKKTKNLNKKCCWGCEQVRARRARHWAKHINDALLARVPMSPVWISQLAMSQFRNILVSPVGISLIIILARCQSDNPHSLQRSYGNIQPLFLVLLSPGSRRAAFFFSRVFLSRLARRTKRKRNYS